MAEAEVDERVERTRRALGDLDHDAIASILDLADSSRTRTPAGGRVQIYCAPFVPASRHSTVCLPLSLSRPAAAPPPEPEPTTM